MTLPVGSKIPDVEGVLQDGSSWRSADLRGKPLVVYFYPKDFTPGCTKEACTFRDAREELVGLYGAEIYGVSQDTSESHARWASSWRMGTLRRFSVTSRRLRPGRAMRPKCGIVPIKLSAMNTDCVQCQPRRPALADGGPVPQLSGSGPRRCAHQCLCCNEQLM